MRLSRLQRYILTRCHQTRSGRIGKKELLDFYSRQQGRGKRIPSLNTRVNIITRSVERLIDKELVTGYGWRTPHRWFTSEVKLTPAGRKAAKKLQGVQQELPFPKFKQT